ncbi:LGFP repeat-containing protein [Nocardia sp. NPDC003482]
MRRARIATAALTLAGAAAVIAACGDGNDASTSATSTSASPATTSAAGTAAPETRIATPNGEIVVSGQVLGKYTGSGGPTGVLGDPTGAAVPGPDGGSCQEFTGGVICWSPATGAHITWGDIRQRWESAGGVNGALGYPTTDEENAPNGKVGHYAGGSITWNAGDRHTEITAK